MAQMAQTFQEAKPCEWSKRQVQDFASDAAEKLGYKPADDLLSIVKRLGGEVEVADWESVGSTGSITVHGKGKFTISLSPISGDRRDRFTIAHELGHYILHSQMGAVSPMTVNRAGTGRVEWEANWFAAGFLMPEKEFRQKWEAWKSEARLAVHFDVSEAAVEIRKRCLNIVA